MAPLIVGGLLSAGAGLLGIGGQAVNNKAQRELAEYQNEWNLQQWYRQNEYNTPANQMQRYRDAGLNDHLIYSQGSPGNAAGQLTAVRPDVDYNFAPNISKGLSQLSVYQDLMIKQNQTDNLKAQNDLIHQQVIQTAADTALKNQNMEKLWHDNQLLSLISDKRYDRYMAESQHLNLRNDLLKLQQKIGNQSYDFNAKKFPLTMDQLRESARSLRLENNVNEVLSQYGMGRQSPWYMKPAMKLFDKLGLGDIFK